MSWSSKPKIIPSEHGDDDKNVQYCSERSRSGNSSKLRMNHPVVQRFSEFPGDEHFCSDQVLTRVLTFDLGPPQWESGKPLPACRTEL